jgi:hypothetical protein
LEQLQQVSFLHLHTCVYIICTIFIFISLSPPSPPIPPVPNPHPLHVEPVTPSCSLVFWRKNIKYNKKNMLSLLVWVQNHHKKGIKIERRKIGEMNQFGL